MPVHPMHCLLHQVAMQDAHPHRHRDGKASVLPGIRACGMLCAAHPLPHMRWLWSARTLLAHPHPHMPALNAGVRWP